MTSRAPVRRRATRRRRLLRLAVLVVVLAGLATAVALIVTGRTVVPVVSGRIYPIHYRDHIARVAESYDLDPYMVAAVAQTESGYDPQAVSPAGAVGLMQLMPATAEWITTLDSWQGDGDPVLTDPVDSLELGACYLQYLANTFGDGTRPALAAYNAGQGTVGEWIEEAGGVESFDLTDIKFPETRDFVERVEYYWKLYARVHPEAFSGSGGSS